MINCRNDDQVVCVTDCSVHAGFQCGARSLHRTPFYMMPFAGPTKFISIVNSVKMVNMPYGVKEGKVSVCYYYDQMWLVGYLCCN